MAMTKVYNYSEKQLADMINQYFQRLEDDPARKGGPSDLLAAMKMDMEMAKNLCNEPPFGYKKHSLLLKEAAVRLRAHLETSPAWANGNSSKAIFTLKQQLWDGQSYVDKQETTNNTNAKIQVVFGSGKDADKAFD